jgi:hypothetical protein
LGTGQTGVSPHLKISGMPLYRFHIQQNGSPGAGGQDVELADDDAAWTEAAGICRDLGRDLIPETASNSEWQLAVLDESGVAIFRFKSTAEKL